MLFLFVALLTLPITNACRESANSGSIDQVVREIVDRANSNDTQYFERVLDKPYKGQEEKLIGMIKRSEMLTNYKERLEMRSDVTARLNYHYLEKGCHFQVDLARENGTWIIKRIWFCR